MKPYNHYTRITASALGTVLGLAGAINHGLFEILQGNTATGSFFIEAIGPDHRFWIHGTEGAVTLLPTFLLSGIAVIAFSLVVIFWSVKYIQTQNGATVFILLMTGLTLAGGGIGHIVLFLPTWAYATRINKPLSWWRKRVPGSTRGFLSKLWRPTLILTLIAWLIVMQLGMFGYVPGQDNPERILTITLSFVLLTLVLANAAFICAIARDLEASI